MLERMKLHDWSTKLTSGKLQKMKLHYLMYMVCQLLWHRGAWISKIATIYMFWAVILEESPTRSFGSDIKPWIAVDQSLSRFELENTFAGRSHNCKLTVLSDSYWGANTQFLLFLSAQYPKLWKMTTFPCPDLFTPEISWKPIHDGHKEDWKDPDNKTIR